MPFAPVVMAEDAETRLRSRPGHPLCGALHDDHLRRHDAWREHIPAVVHVDGTARPQVIERSAEPALLRHPGGAIRRVTGIPVLVNTSFNVHEEPIINGPDECAPRWPTAASTMW